MAELMDDDVYIVAEASANHNGSLETAIDLCSQAKTAGADAIKFQMRKPEICVPDHMKDKEKDTPWGTMSYLEYRKKLELPKSYYLEIDQHCARIGLDWSASVWDKPSLKQLRDFNPPWIKIPSPLNKNEKLLSQSRQLPCKPIVISLGMMDGVEAHDLIYTMGVTNVIYCQCTSSYPTKFNECDIKYIDKGPLPDRGYSGHEEGTLPTLLAVACGATYVERHFTVDNSMWGSDQQLSLEPDGFKDMVKQIRKCETILGDGTKTKYDSELEAEQRLRPNAS